MAESTQHKLDRVRPPRVQITYDVEVGDATQKKELPFIVGVLADLSGQPAQALPKVKDRKFVEIDKDNFNDVLASIGPRAVFRVDNKLANDGSKINIELKVSHIDDFNPTNIVKQIEPLRKLLEARQRLNDLLGKLDGNDKLDELLQEVVANSDELKELKTQTGGGGENG
jgi:type VI secretion system protein ImpB